MDKLPKASWTLIFIIVAQISGFVWFAAQQVSTIAGLEETVSELSAQSEIQDKVNMQRDILQNADNIDEFVEILVEVQEEGEETAAEVYDEIELIWQDMDGFTEQFIQIIKLQARIAVLEKTVEFNRKDGM